jgi:hypothetical protein
MALAPAAQRLPRLVSAILLLMLHGASILASAKLEAAEGTSTPGQQSPVVPAETPDVNGSAFRVRLSDGAAVELIGVCEAPSANHFWWRPDGSALKAPPVGTFDKSFNVRPIPNSLLREFAVDSLIGTSAEVSEARHGLDGVLHLAHPSSTVNAGGKVRQELRLILQIPANSSTTIALDYALGPWETVTTFNRPANAIFHSHKRRDGTGVVMGRPDEGKDATSIMATYDLDDLQHKIVRIVAVDNDNHLHLPDGDLQQSLRNAHVLLATFRGLKRAQIRSFTFQTRSVQHIDFRNVSLQAGQRTNFEIFVDGKPAPRHRSAPARRAQPAANDRLQLRGVQTRSRNANTLMV